MKLSNPTRAESAEVPIFRSFENGDIRIRALPKREELLVLDWRLRGFPRQGIRARVGQVEAEH
jgi:hypothetical protein